jgi:hypothetical protein
VKDLTAHSIGKHILQMALPIAVGLRSRLRHRITGAAASLEAG